MGWCVSAVNVATNSEGIPANRTDGLGDNYTTMIFVETGTILLLYYSAAGSSGTEREQLPSVSVEGEP
jgi:hypothetical protein